MSGLTNWTRAKCLDAIAGTDFAALAGTFVNLLTVNPTSESIGGVTNETEWTLDRIEVNTDGATVPYWVKQGASDDGVELVTSGAVTWDASDTGALADTTTCVGLGVFTASTDGTLISWQPFDDDLVVQVGEVITFSTGSIALQLRSDL